MIKVKSILYTIDKKKIFTSPAFNFDEVSELPKNAILLSSDKVNNVMGVSF